jgi:hypothetical protein
MPHESQVVGWPGRTVFDADGSKVGKIEDVFADARTGRPAWATVSSGLFGRRHHFVPIEHAREVEDGVAVPVAGQLIKGAPNVDPDGDLSRDDERTLYRHYGMDDGERDGSDVTAGSPAVDADHDGRDDGTEHDARGEEREAHGYTHHDERTRHDADGDGRDDRHESHHDADGDGRDDRLESRHGADGGGRDDRLESRHGADGDGRDDRAEGHGAAPGLAGAGAAAGTARGAHRADEARSDRASADHHAPDGRRGDHDDARGSGVPPTLQADATTEALARAERERLATAEAEHDRLAARPAAAPPHEPPVLDRELAQQDLSVAPARDERSGPDGSLGHDAGSGHPAALDEPVLAPQHDPTGSAGGTSAGRPAPDADRGDPDRAGTTGSPASGTPGVGTRLRRLARSISPSSKDDHHG